MTSDYYWVSEVVPLRMAQSWQWNSIMTLALPDHPTVLANTLTKALEKIRLQVDLSKDTLDYFLVKDPKFARFYLLPKIHK